MKFVSRLCLVFVFLFASCSGKIEPRTQTAMDTLCTVNAFEDGTKKLYDEIFERLAQIEKEFSATLPDSEISRINSMAGISAVKTNEEVLNVLDFALKTAWISDGAFTPAAGPLVDLGHNEICSVWLHKNDMQYQNLYCNQCCTRQIYPLSVAIFCVRWHGWSELFPAIHLPHFPIL